MTPGSIVFFSGVGLMGLTLILGIVFFIKKPKYTPEKEVYNAQAAQATRRLRNGYPTDPLTVRREPANKTVPIEEGVANATLPLQQETEMLDEQTVLLQEGPVSGEKTVLLDERTESLMGEEMK